MINLADTPYNEAKDGMVPIAPGVYPAHVCGLEAKELQTKAGEQTVFNVTFLIADEVANTKVPKMIKSPDGDFIQENHKDGQPKTISAVFMKAKKFNSTGIWLTPRPEEGHGWKNRKYKEFFEHLGVVFPVDKNSNTMLAIVEEEDIIGYPCLVKLAREEYIKDGETRGVWKVFDAFQWSGGSKLSFDEVKGDDLPF